MTVPSPVTTIDTLNVVSSSGAVSAIVTVPVVAVPPTLTSAPVNVASSIGSLNTAVKTTGLASVGSAWPPA